MSNNNGLIRDCNVTSLCSIETADQVISIQVYAKYVLIFFFFSSYMEYMCVVCLCFLFLNLTGFFNILVVGVYKFFFNLIQQK